MNALDVVVPGSNLAAPLARGSAEATRAAAAEFEAMVIGELIKPMFDSLDADVLGGGGAGERMFRPMLVERYAEGLAARGGIGLADAVSRELLKLQEGADGAVG
jgi:Rod binding domain-containing protein